MKTNNNIKRAFCFVLIAIMTLSIMPFGLFDAAAKAQTKTTEITEVLINDADITPVLGKKAGECLNYTLPTDAPFTVTYHGWYIDTQLTDMDDNSVFEEGNKYSCGWTLKAKDGFIFTKTTKTLINDSETVIDADITNVDSDDNTIFYVWTNSFGFEPTTDKTAIDTININETIITPISGKKAGELISYTLPVDAQFTITYNCWRNDTKGEEMDNDSIFETGNKYSHGWTLKAKDGYTFTAETKVFINGSESNVDKEWTWMDNADNTVFYVWSESVELTGTSELINIDTIQINNTDIIPISGKTVNELYYYTIPTDAPYTVWGTLCTNITDNKPMDYSDAFEEGKEYSFGWLLNAKDGYTFTEDTKVLINGIADFVNAESSNIFETPKQFEVWTIPTKAVAESEKTLIDTININGTNTAPKAGTTSGESVFYTIPDDAPYIVTELYWYNDTEGRFMDNYSVFEAGSQYSFGMVIKAKDGYNFTSETKVLVDGSEANINADSTGLDYFNCSVFYVWLKPVNALSGEIELGDVNLDGKVNTGDAVLILRQIAGAVTFTEEQTSLADFNKDGKVNTGDAVAILKYCVGI